MFNRVKRFTSPTDPRINARGSVYPSKEMSVAETCWILLACALFVGAGAALLALAGLGGKAAGALMVLVGAGEFIRTYVQYQRSPLVHNSFELDVRSGPNVLLQLGCYWENGDNVLHVPHAQVSWVVQHGEDRYDFERFPQRNLETWLGKGTDLFSAALIVSELEDFITEAFFNGTVPVAETY